MKLKIITGFALSIALIACGGEKTEQKSTEKKPASTKVTKEVVEKPATEVDMMSDKGVGPITSVNLGEIDNAMVEKGKEIFKAKCAACHKIDKRFVGPAIIGITERRSPEWIMNMILNPEVMVVENEIAKKLLAEYNAPMANQGLTEEEARAVLEYFRTKN